MIAAPIVYSFGFGWICAAALARDTGSIAGSTAATVWSMSAACRRALGQQQVQRVA